MDFTGRICEVSRDFSTKRPMLKFIVNEEPNGIDDMADKDLKITVKKATKPRSLDANAYFHVLCDKLRLKLGISMSHMKNILITSYGQIEYIEDQAIIYKTNAPEEYIQELEAVHMKFIKQGEDGAYWYKVYRGSHTYDSAEMHKLLEGTIYEAKEQGIETSTPEEIRRMEMLWSERISK
ncbi:MAG: hypothetical protein IIZ78_08260 [Clostridiales bacterium]|nr:hypothetical protein [Clostridiales bacterium]